MNDITRFVVKVILLSAALSLLLKYGGPLLPFQAPYTPATNRGLNGIVTAIVVLPSLAIGIGLASRST
ncbi:MAG: hypothetical protein WBB01_13325 [Phormidesmis sp.]